MSDNISIKVTPTVLSTKANQIEERISRINDQWGNLYMRTMDLGSYWEGEASEAEWKDINLIKEDMEQIIKRLKEYPVDLRQMTGVYSETEETAIQISNTLKAGFIS